MEGLAAAPAEIDRSPRAAPARLRHPGLAAEGRKAGRGRPQLFDGALADVPERNARQRMREQTREKQPVGRDDDAGAVRGQPAKAAGPVDLHQPLIHLLADGVKRRLRRDADGHEDAAMWEAFKKALIRSPRAVPAHAQARATRRPVVIDDVTESEIASAEHAALARDVHVWARATLGAADRARLDRATSEAWDALEREVERVGSRGRKKPDAAEIETQDGRCRAVQAPGAPEQGAVAAEGDQALQLIGRHVSDFYRGGMDEARALMRRLRAEARIRRYRTTFRKKDGGWAELDLGVALARDSRGAVVGTVGTVEGVATDS